MSFEQISATLAEVSKSQVLYVYTQPEVLDFTASVTAEIVICGQEEVRLSLNKENVLILWSLLKLSVFGEKRKVIGWNLKNIFSYFLYHTQKDFKAECSLIDLKIMESYLGISKPKPESLGQALSRVRSIFNSGLWEALQPVYNRLHLFLATNVIPSLETRWLLDNRLQSHVHAYYKIDGQENGRLKCEKAYSMGFVPHAMHPEDRENIIPAQLDEFFMYFDYKNMEVAVLQWLSKDEKLGEMLKTADFYTAIYETVVGNKGDREFAKKFFLPTFYGISAKILAEKLNIGIDKAETIQNRIFQLFPTSIKWIEGQQQSVKDGVIVDCFGKRRIIDLPYKARNFVVQAPAALICMDKLISLYKTSVQLAFSVHDGYVVLANKKNWKEIYKTVVGILESESSLAPGLLLKVKCKAGRNLNCLKSVGRI